MVPTMGRCPRFPRPGCSGQVRTEGAQAATAAPQNLGFGRGGGRFLSCNTIWRLTKAGVFPPCRS